MRDVIRRDCNRCKCFRAGQAVFVFRSAIDTIENNFHTGILRVNPFGLKKRVYDLKDRAKLFLEEE